jgi:putative glycosyltransferase (TIGR04372 family)
VEWLKGRKLLNDLGVPKGCKYVCLIVRDDAYLKAKMPGSNMSYHDYRNADVDNYVEAAKYLATKGYYVLRMGDITAKPITNPHIIDYANSGLRSDFGDLFLGAHCAFCFGTSTGFMVIPQVFKRPCAVTDFAPLEYISTFCEDRVILKQHWKDGKRMSMAEIVESGAGQWTNGNNFTAAGIELRDNTPEEICQLVQEMVEGCSTDQTEFWEAYPKGVSEHNNRPLHGAIKCRIGQKYLEAWKAS